MPPSNPTSSAKPLDLRAGPLRMVFDPTTLLLRRVLLGRNEVLRGIYAAVRDRNWGTVPPRLTRFESELRSDSFELRFEVDCQSPGIQFVWRGTLAGAVDGTLLFVFDGEARTAFLRNRIGFCVLHAIHECSGKPAHYILEDGTRGVANFPARIEPQIFGHATFSGLRAFTHEVRPGTWAELRFEGDVFEMEDQRNWTDASFKTYCTPLGKPFPVEIASGSHISQSVSLRLTPGPFEPNTGAVQVFEETGIPAVGSVELAVPSRPEWRLPSLGVCLARHGQALSQNEAAQLRTLRLSHLRADLRLGGPDWMTSFDRALVETVALSTGLELAIHLPATKPETRLREISAVLENSKQWLRRMAIFRDGEPVTTKATLALARQYLGSLRRPIGGGTNAHFCELNRGQALGNFAAQECDFVCWPMTPQVHAFDDLSLMETLEAQPDAVAAVRAFRLTQPLCVSPVTLKPRFNAVATGPEAATQTGTLPEQFDRRQALPFAAAWALGSIAALASAGVENATYFETTGWGGLMQTESGLPSLSSFPAPAGAVYPVFCIFAVLAGFRHAAPLCEPDAAESWPDRITGLCLFGEAGPARALIANLSGSQRDVALRVGTERVEVTALTGLGTVMPEPGEACLPGLLTSAPTRGKRLSPGGLLTLHLPAYGVVCLEFAPHGAGQMPPRFVPGR